MTCCLICGAIFAVAAYFFHNIVVKGKRCTSDVKLHGKIAIVTGSNTGIGKETAVDLARRGARVIMACRSRERAEAALEDVKRRSGSSNVVFMQLDLASLKSVRTFAENFLKSEPRLDLLINNAGMFSEGWTQDGFGMTFGVNHLGHFLLTVLLLDRLKESGSSRVVTVSSAAHNAGRIDFDCLTKHKALGLGTSWLSLFQRYNDSKLCNVLFTYELNKRLKGTKVTCYSLHPGAIKTEFVRNFSSILVMIMTPPAWFFFKTPEQGAQTTLHCALQQGLEPLSGRYFSNCTVRNVFAKARDDATAKKLWELSERMCGLQPFCIRTECRRKEASVHCGDSADPNMTCFLICGAIFAVAVYYFHNIVVKGKRCTSDVKLHGKIAIVTGSNTGIGKETAVDLARRGARVIMACRSRERAEAALEDVKRKSGSSNVVFMQLDLASLKSVRTFAENFLKSEPRLDLLINNAGMFSEHRTEDGFGMTFGVNHLGHFLLTVLLLDRLKESGSSRVVTVSSGAHNAGRIDFDCLTKHKALGLGTSWLSLFQRYNDSKLCNVLFTYELNKRLKGTKVTCYSLHPGSIKTEFVRNFSRTFILFMTPLTWFFLKTPEQGAQTTLHCALEPGLEPLSGRYFSNCTVRNVYAKARDDAAAKKLWELIHCGDSADPNMLSFVICGAVFVIAVYYFREFCRKGRRCTSDVKLHGKIAIVTGSNTGIGKETALDLARRGARVIMACRSRERAEAALEDVKRKSGSSNVVFMQLDLASLKSVRTFAENFLKSEPTLDLLINNAGLFSEERTEDGFGMTFQVNHLGHFLLTVLLLDRLKKSGSSRVVTVSSATYSSGSIDFDCLTKNKALGLGTSWLSLFQRYYDSKLCNVLFTHELNKRLKGTKVTCYSLHPGVIKTEFIRNFNRLLKILLSPMIWFSMTPEQGVQTTLHCALQPGLEPLSGRYFSDCTVQNVNAKARDDATAKKLWELSSNTGIGKETALDLARRGARVIMACRNKERAEAALEDVKRRSGSSNVVFMHLDLASLTSVRNFAEKFLKSEPRLDILINNAGMFCEGRTEDGIGTTFQVNHLSHFLLTLLLLDRLKESGPSRVVNVSSMAHSAGRINFDTLIKHKALRLGTSWLSLFQHYNDTKLCTVLFTRELSKRLKGTNVTCYSLHPGGVKTDFVRNFSIFHLMVMIPLFWGFFKTPEQGAQTTLHCALQPGLEPLSGRYFSNCTARNVYAKARDDAAAKKLWEISERMCGLI
ncbi:hypothetical protein WMY93_028881 [Mugilogobius chulae]|uniref:Uncharacterized protein n=1 Tax=Mugilogobius chulae TaxID=88201 RepID=A0AAW0MZZ7_9GOBI